jgi:hypothetical protein
VTFERDFDAQVENTLAPSDKRDLHPDAVPSVLRDDRAWAADHARSGLCWLCRAPLVQHTAVTRLYLGFKLKLHVECNRRLR